MANLFEKFNFGQLVSIDGLKEFSSVAWNTHPSFEGVELKNIVTSDETQGAFSYHLVRIAPNKKIGIHTHSTQLETHEVISGHGVCINGGKKIEYYAGTISIIKSGTQHEVIAGSEGLHIFAKFIPALC